MGDPHPAPRARRRGHGLVAIVAVTVLALVGVLGVVAGRVVRTDPEPAAPTGPPARVDWGIDATVTLHPDPGVSMEQMRDRVRRAVAQRAAARDGAGVEVIRAEQDRMVVRLPGAENPAQAGRYLTFRRLVILDEARSVIATGTTLTALRSAADRLIGPDTPVVYWVQRRRTGSAGIAPAERFANRADAERRRLRIGAARADLITTPVGVEVVVMGDGERSTLTLVRDDRAVPSSRIIGIEASERQLTLTLDASSSPVRPGPVLVLIADPAVNGRLTTLGRGSIGPGPTARIDTRSEAELWLDAFATPDLGGTIRMAAHERYGTRPPLVGTPYTPPAGARIPGLPSSNIQWTQVMARDAGAPRDLLVGQDHGTTVAFAEKSENGGITPMAAGGTGGTCPGAGPGTPRVVVCGGSVGSDAPERTGTVRATVSTYGRVHPDVADMSISVAGDPPRPVHIQNGWFYISLTRDLPTSRLLDPLDVLGGLRSHLSARDRDGNPIPVQESGF